MWILLLAKQLGQNEVFGVWEGAYSEKANLHMY